MDPRTRSLIMGAAGVSGAAATYIEDVFSTWLYDGNGSTQTITNGIDLSGKGGLVWIKNRSSNGVHTLVDTARGATKYLMTNNTTGEQTQSQIVPNFFSSGFETGSDNQVSTSPDLFASWTFRKAAKFFDVVTYTGNGSNRTIAHNLGSVPGCIIVKRTDTTADWQVYHRSLANTEYLTLNTTSAANSGANRWNSTAPTSSVFSLGTALQVNELGGSYVAYLFAHDTDPAGLIQCGSYVGNGNAVGPVIDLGWEPQWVLLKSSTSAANWYVFDNMRGVTTGGGDNWLIPNTADAEVAAADAIDFTATGFSLKTSGAGLNGSSTTFIYIAIRRGPMKTPTDATKVFQPKVYTGTNVDNRLVTTDIVTDMVWARQRNDTVLTGMVVGDRMRGQPYLLTGSTAAEVSDADSLDQQLVSAVEYGTAWSSMTGFYVGNDATSKLNANTTSNNHVVHAFRRAPGFFDVVAYTGTSVARTVSHNLGVAPELWIIKDRGVANSWVIGGTVLSSPTNDYLDFLNTAKNSLTNIWQSPTSTTIGIGTGAPTSGSINFSGSNYIAYLFATLTGVSKVGSYTGTGTTLNIDCGFTNGARFVLIKRTDAADSWYVFDTARGLISGDDVYLLLNTAAAEVTNTDWIEPINTGFRLLSAGSSTINANGGTFIYLAIA